MNYKIVEELMDIRQMLEERKRFNDYCDTCEFETPEAVARLFKEYTNLIWNKKLVGLCYDFYTDDIVIHREGGVTATGYEGVIAATLSFMAAFPNLEFEFLDIFAEGNPEDGYRFGQSLYYKGENTGYSSYGEPSGKSLSPEDNLCLGLCECLVQKVDGRWKIVEEWLVRSGDSLEEIMTKDRSTEMVASSCEESAGEE
jgi:ketosteroid isomerase-like protein